VTAPAAALEAPAIDSASSSAALEVPATVGPASTRRPVLLYALLALIALGAIAAIVFVATRGSDEEDALEVRRTGPDYTGLGRRIDDPSRPHAGSAALPGTAAGSAPGTAAGSVRRPSGGTARPPGGGTATGTAAVVVPGTGAGSEVALPPGATTPLSPDDVLDMSRRMGAGTRRCYDHALKQDPFLKVPKIVATIAVAPSGQVSNVQLSQMTGTTIGKCLEAAIRRWRFRASTEGIVSDISMIFGPG
jgi:hypothetical protein